MPRIKILTNGGHFGILNAVGCHVPARKVLGRNMYSVKRKHFITLGARPYSDDDEFWFQEGVECVVIPLWKTLVRYWFGTCK